ncbi:MAG: family 43 glycosylhydrolase [Lachnospiraceae bacterium]|nr:family 43 glycosylhydrolase [Lachnospiraceae bacterium]
MFRKRYRKILMTFCVLGTMIFCACGKEAEPLKGTGESGQAQIQEQETPKQTETVEKENVEVKKEMTREDFEAMFKGVKNIIPSKGINDTNPIMTQKYGADPYAMVYGDTVYFYMTADAYEYDAAGNIIENSYQKIKSLNVVSTKDMINFEDHGEVQVTKSAKWANNSWAPAAAWKNIDGKDKFFLYFADAGGGIGVLTADSPLGPFTDPLGKGIIRRDMPNCGNVLWLFDPAVLVDDDGKAYIYFGGGVPQDKISDPGTGRVAQLGDDMISIVGEPVRIDAPYLFEDSGIHKFNNKYYYTYCSNWQVDKAGTDKYGFVNAEIVCLESDSPMGPFTYKETILENPGRYIGLYGNNHHCVFTFKDRWYMTYHSRVLEKKLGIEHGYRITNINEFTMQEDGTIGKIGQSLSGREQLVWVNPYEENNATKVALMSGLSTVPADEQAINTGCGTYALTGVQPGAFVKIQGVDFGTTAPKKFIARIKNNNAEMGAIALRTGQVFGEAFGYLAVEETTGEEFVEFTAELDTDMTGVQDLFMVFSGEGFEVLSWRFE